jgi:hypothetical protein
MHDEWVGRKTQGQPVHLTDFNVQSIQVALRQAGTRQDTRLQRETAASAYSAANQDLFWRV